MPTLHNDPGDENDAPAVQQMGDDSNGPVDLSLLAVGRALRIKTLNSTYVIRKQPGGLTWRIEQTKAAEGGYNLAPNPVVGEIATNYLAPGRSLMFTRESPNPAAAFRLTCTSPIVSIEKLK